MHLNATKLAWPILRDHWFGYDWLPEMRAPTNWPLQMVDHVQFWAMPAWKISRTMLKASKWGNQHNSRASFPTKTKNHSRGKKKQSKKLMESFKLPSISGKSRTFFKSLLVTIETKRSSASRIKSLPTLIPKSWAHPNSWMDGKQFLENKINIMI